MEKKTIGAFISALRKANGLTQKQLAEKLCVSDKAISRWERDECAPDLTLIPVIAEIFGVTTDELLRGQRRNPEAADKSAPEAKTQLQLKRILQDTQTKYQIRSLICVGVAAAGIIVSLICNFAFLRAILGFGIGCIFLCAALLLFTIFTIQAKASLADTQTDDAMLVTCRNSMYRSFCRSLGVILIYFPAIILPLVLVGNAYMGITFESWLVTALVFSAVSVFVYFVTFSALTLYMQKKGLFVFEEHYISKLQLRFQCILISAGIIVCAVFLQAIANSVLPSLFVKGTTFDSWEDYKTFMETPSPEVWYENGDMFITEPMEGTEWAEEYPLEQIFADDGKVLCEFRAINQNVYSTSYSFDKSEDGLPVTVITYSDYHEFTILMDDLINPSFFIAYFIIATVALMIYLKKSRSLR